MRGGAAAPNRQSAVMDTPSLFHRTRGRRLLPFFMALLCSLTLAQAETIRVGGTGSGLGLLQKLALQYAKQEPGFQAIVVPSLGSSGGLKAAAHGAIDLAVSSRPLSPEEESGTPAVLIGQTAFVLATAKAGVQGLALTQLAEMYSGRQVRWPDGQPVRLVLRQASDVDTLLLARLSPAMKLAVDAAMAREGMIIALTDQDAVDVLERVPGTIGPTTQALLLSEGRRLAALAIDGLVPTVAHVASGRYPWAKPLLLVPRPGAPPVVHRFVAWVASDGARRLLAEYGVDTSVAVRRPAAR